MVMRNGEVLKLEFFDEISFEDYEGGKPVEVIFRAGYPDVDGNSVNTVYQVLSKGPKVHLLKFLSQKVEAVNTMGDYNRKELVNSNQLFVYDVESKKISKIKKDRKSLADALPTFSARITELAGSRKIKSEDDISLLVEQLNAPQ
jgi:hypothetical protein